MFDVALKKKPDRCSERHPWLMLRCQLSNGHDGDHEHFHANEKKVKETFRE